MEKLLKRVIVITLVSLFGYLTRISIIQADTAFTIVPPTRGILTQSYHRDHRALDYENRLNTPIYAAAAGEVIVSQDGWNYGYGNYVIIDHGNDHQTLYAHLNKRRVEVGDTVTSGQIIGNMGNTGRVFGPTGIHLHFELKVDGWKVDPKKYLN